MGVKDVELIRTHTLAIISQNGKHGLPEAHMSKNSGCGIMRMVALQESACLARRYKVYTQVYDTTIYTLGSSGCLLYQLKENCLRLQQATRDTSSLAII